MKKISDLKSAMLYAQALYDGAEEAGDVDIVYQDKKILQTAVEEKAQDFNKINNPLWKLQDKIKILEQIAEKLNLTTSLLNLLKILAENGKLNLLSAVLQQFSILYNDKHNIAEVEVITVIPLNKQQETLLKEKLTSIFKKEIILHYIINPQIIGGLILKYGTNFIDNSIKHKLNALEQLMKGTK